jgi:hypothetical protein
MPIPKPTDPTIDPRTCLACGHHVPDTKCPDCGQTIPPAGTPEANEEERYHHGGGVITANTGLCATCGRLVKKATTKSKEAGMSREVIYKSIEKLGNTFQRSDRSLTKEQAVVKVLETDEGRALEAAYRSAPPDEIEEVVTKAEPVLGGQAAQRAAAALDKLDEDVAVRSSVSKAVAYDQVFASAEGAELLGEYRSAAGDTETASNWSGFAKARK